jgi:hypothetical protein
MTCAAHASKAGDAMRWGVVAGRAPETEKLHVEQGEEGGESPTSSGDGEVARRWIMVMLNDSGW